MSPDDAPDSFTANVTFGTPRDGDTSPFEGAARLAYASPDLIVQLEGAQEQVRIPRASVVFVGRSGRTLRLGVVKEEQSKTISLAYACVVTVDTDENAAHLEAALDRPGLATMRGAIADQIAFTAGLHTATPRTFVTQTLLAINVLIFVAMVATGVSPVEPQNQELVEWGASFGLKILDGEWWRIGTAMFVHIGLIHIALNMWVLYSIGRLVERVFGNAMFAFVYLAAGAIASLASLTWNPVVVAAGASGAIFGLIGALLGFALRQRRTIPVTVLKGLRNSTIGFVGYNVVFGLSVPGIDNAAHLGGLFAGAVIGLLAARPLELVARRAASLKRIPLAVLAAAALAFGGIQLALHSPYRAYVEFEDLLIAEEEEAVRAFNRLIVMVNDDELRNEALAQQFEERCLARWKRVVDAARRVRIPAGSPLAAHARKLTSFARLRAEALEHLVRALREGDSTAMDQYLELQHRADSTLESLSK